MDGPGSGVLAWNMTVGFFCGQETPEGTCLFRANRVLNSGSRSPCQTLGGRAFRWFPADQWTTFLSLRIYSLVRNGQRPTNVSAIGQCRNPWLKKPSKPVEGCVTNCEFKGQRFAFTLCALDSWIPESKLRILFVLRNANLAWQTQLRVDYLHHHNGNLRENIQKLKMPGQCYCEIFVWLRKN